MADVANVEYWVGAISEPADFLLLTQIDRERYDAVDEALSSIYRLEHSFSQRLVERNFLSLEELHKFVTIAMSLGRNLGTLDHKMLMDAIMTTTVNWLTSMRLFLDHAETDLKARYGKKSEQVEAFESATKVAFDNHVGYRFVTKLRNYIQHCGLPSAHVRIDPDPDSTIAHQRAALFLDRDQLLESYKGWGPVKKDLQAMQSKFSLLPLAMDAMQGLRNVARVVTELDLDVAVETFGVLTEAWASARDAPDFRGKPAIIVLEGTFGEKATCTPRLLPTTMLQTLAAIDSGEVSRAALIDHKPANPSPLSVQSIAKLLHPDTRGVQVMTAWFVQGGQTPSFFQTINDIIEEDQSIDPLIGGLIHVSATLLHMTSQLLGSQPESLLSGLLDIYTADQETHAI